MLSNALSLLAFNVIVCYGQNSTSQLVMKFGPLALAEYSDVGSQEVIYVPIPAAYLRNFAFEWSGGIAKKGGGSPDCCPKVVATILVRKWGIPIPNPNNASYPSNTWMNGGDTASGTFYITQSLPDKHDQFIMLFEDEENTTGEYYISSFVSAEIVYGDDDRKIPSDCQYIVQLSVIAYSDILYEDAAIVSTTQLQSLGASNYESDFSLERYRKGLLSTEYITAKEGYNISLNSSTRLSWIVQPYSDVGGTLKIQIGLASEKSLNGTLVIKGCATWNANWTFYDHCNEGHEINVNTSESTSQVWYWPFPRSGLWVLNIGIECVSGDCDWMNTIDIDIDIIQCIESCHSDKTQGECKIFRTDVLFFSACDCKGGWQGIACDDGTDAVPRSRQLLMTLLLTLSNLIFFPCGLLAIIKGYYSESIVYFFVMFFSTFYHACDNDFSIALCIMQYNSLQFSDFYGSITAMWVTLIAIAKLPFRLESLFHVLGFMAISIAVTYNRFSVFTTLIPVLCGLFILAVRWGRECRSTHSCYPAKKDWIFSIVPGIICAIVGFVLFAFVENSGNYFYVHSMWHILMGSAVLFLIPKEKKYSWLYDDDSFSSSDESVPGMHGNANDVTTFHLEISDDSS